MNDLSIGPLSTLAPRVVSADTVEPHIQFDETMEGLHPANRCPATCGCTSTVVCVTTGSSDFS